MQIEPTEAERVAMAARGWEWVDRLKSFYPIERALQACEVRLMTGGWCAIIASGRAGSSASDFLPLSEAADWVRDELRKVAMRSPIFAGLVEARWERTASRLWMLYIGTCPVVAVWEEASKFTFSVYGMGRHAATWEEVKTWVARFGLPPLPADAWEVQGG